MSRVLVSFAALLFALPPASATDLRFTDATASSGIDFKHHAGRSQRRLMPEILGSGVALADFNRDGASDVLLINSGEIGGDSRPAGAGNRLYLNRGDGRFVDRTREWQLPSSGYGMGAAVGDFDNDGWVDVLLTTLQGPGTLLRNTGSHFVDVTRQAGLGQDGSWGSSAGFFDLELDGDLDLWIVRYLDYHPEEELPCYFNRQPVYCTPLLLEGLPGKLWINNGDGTFRDGSGRIEGFPGKGLGLVLGDVDLDGDTDIYVANDTTPNHLWINDGRGGLAESGLLAGVALSEFGAELAGMGADMSDVDGDGRMDLVVSNFQSETTTVYLQTGAGIFREVSDAIGIGRAARARLSFGIDFFDADNDGDEDLLSANGHLYDTLERFSRNVTFEQRNTLFECLENGQFRDVSQAAGNAFESRSVSRGLATGDLDGDGDLDFVITNNDGRAQIGLNETHKKGNFVGLWLEGRIANRSAIGARVEAVIGDRKIVRQVYGASSYLSMNDLRVHLGLGEAEAVERLTVFWPGSKPQDLGRLTANRHYHIVEGGSAETYTPGAVSLPPSTAAH